MNSESRQSIRVSARVGFEKVEEIAARLHGIDFPIELALPWRYTLWQEAIGLEEQMFNLLWRVNLSIPSVHSTQGKISDSEFLSWGRKTCELAEQLGAAVITVHPNRAKSNRSDYQESACQNLRKLQRKTPVCISVETFGDKNRVLRPEEIMQRRLPMTLDIAHLPDDNQVIGIIRDYWQNIPVVHLSARSLGEHHLPVDEFCIEVIRTLVDLGWMGQIVLEYLPWHHYRLRSDMLLVNRALRGKFSSKDIQASCDVYRDQPEMWHHNASAPS